MADALQLQREHIDIWQFSLQKLPKNAVSLLDQAEQARASRFHFPQHQRRFTVAHAMMRAILGRYLRIEPSMITFLHNPYGKPYIMHDSGIVFNLSHSGDLALFAIGQTFPLGIDLEFFSPRSYDDLAKTVFSETEVQALKIQPESLKAKTFFHIWAQKEAFIKACGLGLHYPIQQFSVPIFSKKKALIHETLEDKFWKIKSFMPKKNCYAALCCHPEVTSIRKIRANPDRFL